MLREIDLQQRKFQELEDLQLKKIQREERSFYSSVASSVGSLIRRELEMFGQNLNISQPLLKLETVLLTNTTSLEEEEDRSEEKEISDHGFVFVDPETKRGRNSLMRSLSGSVLSLTSTKDREAKKEKKKCNKLYDIAESSMMFFETEEEREDEDNDPDDKENVGGFLPIPSVEEERFLLARRNSFLSPRPAQLRYSARTEVGEEHQNTTILIKNARNNNQGHGLTHGITNIEEHLELIQDQNNQILSNMDQSSELDNLLNIGLGYL